MKRKLVIEREVMENEIENKNKIKVKTKYWHECQHCCHRHKIEIKLSYWIENREWIK